MKMKWKRNMQVMWILKTLLACYFVTGVLLLVLSFLLYRFELSEQVVTAGIVATYVISTFAGGFVAGKIKGKQKILWGALVGAIYFLLLILISYGMYRQVGQQGTSLITAAVLCIGGGALGGILA